MIKIQQVGLCRKNWTESGVFGQEVLCIQEMETDFSLRNGSLKIGLKVSLMVNFSSAGDSFRRQFQQLRKELQLIQNGKMSDILYLTLQP